MVNIDSSGSPLGGAYNTTVTSAALVTGLLSDPIQGIGYHL